MMGLFITVLLWGSFFLVAPWWLSIPVAAIVFMGAFE